MASNIVVLDCQKMFVEGMESYFKISDQKYDIVARVCTSDELQKTIEQVSFDILITDLNVPDQDGMIVIENLRKSMPDVRILVLSSYTDFKLVKSAMIKGADGYISKGSTFQELVYGLEVISLGETYIGDGLRTSPSAFTRSSVPEKSTSEYEDVFTLKNKLTKRECEILELITHGMSNKIIAGKLYISDQTVGVHRKNIMKKLGIRNAASLIKFALENHLV